MIALAPNFTIALEHQLRKALRYRRQTEVRGELVGKLLNAEIALESMRLVQEYNCEAMVISRVMGRTA